MPSGNITPSEYERSNPVKVASEVNKIQTQKTGDRAMRKPTDKDDKHMTEEAREMGALTSIEEVVTDPEMTKFYQDNAEFFQDEGDLEDHS